MRQSERGFTIIELIVVMAVIGILATIGLPKFRNTRERATRASMLSDLKNLVAVQESYFSSTNDYAGGTTTGPEILVAGDAGRVTFRPSTGNVITLTRTTTAVNGAGWAATATNPQVTSTDADVCGIFVGHTSYSPNAAVTQPGIPACY